MQVGKVFYLLHIDFEGFEINGSGLVQMPHDAAGWTVDHWWCSAWVCCHIWRPTAKWELQDLEVASSLWAAFGWLWLQLQAFWALFVVVLLACCVTTKKMFTHVKCMFLTSSVLWPPRVVHGVVGCMIAAVELCPGYSTIGLTFLSMNTHCLFPIGVA